MTYLNEYKIEQRIPDVALWQVVANDKIVVATTDTQHKAEILIEALNHAETGNPGNDMLICWDHE